ncbi:MAG: TonB-dependent receptor plug domain-containing protein, partial [Henriciella sp.]
MTNTSIRRRLIKSTIIAGLAVPLMGQVAFAQTDADDEARQETVTVTGSRIAKQDFTSNSPVATVGAQQFDLTNAVNTEGLLNTLPQTVPGLDRTSNNPGGGLATVNLRGLGSGRTLVLVDGKRVVPSTGGGTVDINNIPSALVERVEVVTGGASAVYGSDAVAGVVNFILKDDFEGIEASTSYEMTEENDAEIFSANLTMGGNFADGRGNAVISLGYTDRQALFQGDRDFSTFAQFDDGAGGLFDGGSSGVPEGRLGGPFDSAGIFNPDGTIREFVSSGDDNDFYNYAPVNYIQLPQERIQFNAKADYEINDKLEIYGSMFMANNKVPQQLAPTPIFEPRG